MIANDIDPRDIKILTFGKSDFNEYLISPFVYIVQPTTKLGIQAVQQLLAEINSTESSNPILAELSSEIST
jgi:DNA-binding LacI/PurR family transcriptional regulator